METVFQHEELSMAWCITCHRNPDSHLRPKEFVTKLDWDVEAWEKETGITQADFAANERKEKNINPKVNCAVCHR